MGIFQTAVAIYLTIKMLYDGTGFKSLLTTNQPKLSKGEEQGYLTSGIHLAPSTMSTVNTCRFASAGCQAACLNTSGHGGIGLDVDGLNDIQRIRIARTNLLFSDRSRWLQIFEREMALFLRKADRLDLIPVFRPNITSDIQWEKIAVTRDGVQYRNMFEAYPEVQFYDYTAYPAHRRDLTISNYHLTFSLKEDNDSTALQALASGMNVAVAIRAKKHALPSTFSGFPVIDGDLDDLRFLDPKGGHIVGLSPKGRAAMHDTSGFIRDVGSVIGGPRRDGWFYYDGRVTIAA